MYIKTKNIDNRCDLLKVIVLKETLRSYPNFDSLFAWKA